MRRGCSFGAGVAVPVGLSLLLSGCGQPSAAQTNSRPPTVTVATPIERVITDYEDYTGRTAAIESVTITPRVTGYLDKICFEEGTEVNEGTVLYEIDPRPYQAAFDQAKASVAQNQASLNLAKSNLSRYLQAYKNKAVTAQDVDTYRSQEQQAAATLEASLASLETARLNLMWTKVTAPIAGRLGQTLISVGNLVTADQTQLTSMMSLDPMYVYFDVDERTVEQVQQLIREGLLKPSLPEEIAPPEANAAKAASKTKGPLATAIAMLRNRAGQLRKVYLALATESGYPHVAYVDFFSNQINLATATLTVRAIFWNPRPKIGPRIFQPGMFVRVRVPTSPPYKALLIAQEGVGTNQNLKYVDVVNDQNVVEQREVTLGELWENYQVVTKGLKRTDRVVINGMQHVHPGMEVSVKLVPMPVLVGPQPQAPSPGSPSGLQPRAAGTGAPGGRP